MSKEPNGGYNTGPPVTADFPAAILEIANEDFAFAVDAIQIAPSGVVFFTGWTDVRPSRLHQVRIRGRCWSKAIDSQYLGRYRQPTFARDPFNTQQPLLGFWSIALYDPYLIDGKLCSVEVVLNTGTSRSADVPIEYIHAKDLKARFTTFWSKLGDLDAEAGEAQAQYALGMLYMNGNDAGADLRFAANWIAKAARRHHPMSQFQLGVMCYTGKGVPQDYSAAVAWYELAAELGYAPAQYNLAMMLAKGKGCKANHEKALFWLRRASEHGLAAADIALRGFEIRRGVSSARRLCPAHTGGLSDRQLAAPVNVSVPHVRHEI